MNKVKDNSSKTRSKEKVAQTAFTVLANLDRYMEACGYGADHPWRAEIASVVPTSPAPQAVHSPARAPLTPMEGDLLRGFRKMDVDSKEFVSQFIAAKAARCPHRAPASLHLVIGGLA